MQNDINNEPIDYNIINLKCIDDINNKIGLILESNLNGVLKILNINYIIDIPKSEIFYKNIENNILEKELEENDNDITKDIYKDYKGNKYNKSMLFDPFE
tara:strand:+ start:3634 stop:3933 length:300 start_codon:yes stop_codon:yes gene_type:complete